eukprot:6465866-Amphidinium_carterae.1
MKSVAEQETSQAVSGLFISAMSRQSRCERPPDETLVMGVDSGAAHSVIPRSVATEYVPRQDKQSGTIYESATGESITDEGESQIMCKH